MNEENKIDWDVKAEYLLVPVEPTEEMYEAGYNVLREIHAGPFGGSPSLGHAGKVFRAMVAACSIPINQQSNNIKLTKAQLQARNTQKVLDLMMKEDTR